LDTDVLVAAFRSERGASRELRVGALDEHFVLLACTALWLEYEAVPTRPLHLTAMGLSAAEGRDVIAALAVAAGAVTIHFFRRPVLADAEDEHVLDLAMNGRAEMLVTFNQDDFAEANRGRDTGGGSATIEVMNMRASNFALRLHPTASDSSHYSEGVLLGVSVPMRDQKSLKLQVFSSQFRIRLGIRF